MTLRPPPKLRLFRYEVADLAARGHALASGHPRPDENPGGWYFHFERVKGFVETSGVDAATVAHLLAPLDPTKVEDEAEEDFEGFTALPTDPRQLSGVQRRAIERRALALDNVANGCTFDRDDVPTDILAKFLKPSLAVAEEGGDERRVRYDRLVRLRPDLSEQQARRIAAALFDEGLLKALHFEGFIVFGRACAHWLEERLPPPAVPAPVTYNILGSAVAVGHGVTAPHGIAQDNRHGGTGTINVQNTTAVELLTQLLEVVNRREDAPAEALVAVAQAKAAARQGNEAGVRAALAGGGPWLREIATGTLGGLGVEIIKGLFGG